MYVTLFSETCVVQVPGSRSRPLHHSCCSQPQVPRLDCRTQILSPNSTFLSLPFGLLRHTFSRLFLKHKGVFAASPIRGTLRRAGLLLGSVRYLSPNQMTFFHLRLQIPNWYKLIYVCTCDTGRGWSHSLPQAI